MKRVPELSQMPKIKMLGENEIGVYFLFDKEKLVYIGKTTKGLLRIYNHARNSRKIFDSYYFHPVDKDDLDKTERYFISKYSPQFNIYVPGKPKNKKKYVSPDYNSIEKSMSQILISHGIIKSEADPIVRKWLLFNIRRGGINHIIDFIEAGKSYEDLTTIFDEKYVQHEHKVEQYEMV